MKRILALALLAGASAAVPSLAQSTAGAAHGDEQRRNLANFDDLEFRVYREQKWAEFDRSHAADVIVHYPDGSTTVGLPDHVKRLQPQFTYAPDTLIREHPIRLADGNYTAVQGTLEGTFSKPLNLGNGKSIPPTGKTFKLSMLTVARWENGVIKEEWLYWDNAALMRQIGVGQ